MQALTHYLLESIIDPNKEAQSDSKNRQTALGDDSENDVVTHFHSIAESASASPTASKVPSPGSAFADEPIAIIGMGCRIAGESSSPEALWQMLMQGTDCIGEVPPSRWSLDEFYNAQGAAGKINTRFGGFLSENVEEFDSTVFGISPREADRFVLRVEFVGVAVDSLCVPYSLESILNSAFFSNVLGNRWNVLAIARRVLKGQV